MKVNRESEKILIIWYIAIGAFLLLIMRLWQLQILQGSEYRKLSEANRLRVITTPAPRGIIFDRSGIPLVRNSPYYYASLIPDEFDKGKVYLLSNVLNIPAEEILQEINTKGLSPFVPVRLKQGLSSGNGALRCFLTNHSGVPWGRELSRLMHSAGK